MVLLHHQSHDHHALGNVGLTLIILGASGDLARKKTFPALFDLQRTKMLPDHVKIVGYARTAMQNNDLRQKVKEGLPKDAHQSDVDRFLERIHYVSGDYASVEGGQKLNAYIGDLEAQSACPERPSCNRLFYFALPPTVFVAMGRTVKATCMAREPGWTRCVIEKPFGKDLDSSNALSRDLGSLFREEDLFRIDHYLGKEMVLNLLVLRFANRVYQQLWDRNSIDCVVITFKEPFGVEGRAGYFDEYGIIRDVMQNHLLQILALVAMERPAGLDPEAIRDAKVKVLKETLPVAPEDCVVGQYAGFTETSPGRTVVQIGYRDDPDVPKGSITPTFATAVLKIENDRWRGVPFILKCGKALNERKAEVRIQFKDAEGSLFGALPGVNELVIRIQPKEAMYVKVMTKTPGMSRTIVETELDMTYNSRFHGARAPEAYERLIYDVMVGDKSNFVRSDELEAAWKIFTPLLKTLEAENKEPIQYKFGGRGPVQSDELAIRYGFRKSSAYKWTDPSSRIAANM